MLSKKTHLIFLSSGLLTSLLLTASTLTAETFSQNASYQVCFTPAQACSEIIVNAINQAKTHIQVQAYSLTSKDIVNALIAASRRGVSVQMIVDQSEFINSSRIWSLLKAGTPVWLDNQVALAHNKVMIFDDKQVLTGSYNFTVAAETKNAENILLIQDANLAKIYAQNWQSRQEHSVSISLAQAKKLQRDLRKTQNRHNTEN